MLLLWIALSLTWPGTFSFTIHNIEEDLCLEDSPEGGVELKPCSLDSILQQWMWTDHWFLVNSGTLRCLSAIHSDPVQTVNCDSGEYIKWQCKVQKLISLKNALVMSSENGKLNRGEQNIWKSVDVADICQNKLRSRRDTDFEPDEFDLAERAPKMGMTEEQMKFLQWYYRTEDPTSMKFGMLAFAFLGLLIGAILLVIGMMANRNRKQIAKYKACTKVTEVNPEMEGLQVIITDKVTQVKEEKTFSSPEHITTHSSHRDWEEPSTNSKASEEMKPGEIVVTWKDGNVSTLYPEPLSEGEGEEDVYNTDVSQNSPQVITSSETIAF